jgi:hypothetical protein
MPGNYKGHYHDDFRVCSGCVYGCRSTAAHADTSGIEGPMRPVNVVRRSGERVVCPISIHERFLCLARDDNNRNILGCCPCGLLARKGKAGCTIRKESVCRTVQNASFGRGVLKSRSSQEGSVIHPSIARPARKGTNKAYRRSAPRA